MGIGYLPMVCCFGFCAATLMMFWLVCKPDYSCLVALKFIFIYCACCLIWTNCDWIIVPLGVLFGQTMRKHIYMNLLYADDDFEDSYC